MDTKLQFHDPVEVAVNGAHRTQQLAHPDGFALEAQTQNNLSGYQARKITSQFLQEEG